MGMGKAAEVLLFGKKVCDTYSCYFSSHHFDLICSSSRILVGALSLENYIIVFPTLKVTDRDGTG